MVILIAVLATIAASFGIFSIEGAGPYEFTSIRGKPVTIYGKGLYKDMSVELAPQGIAQDYITLLAAVPCLLFSLFAARKGSITGRYVLAGVLGYFLVTYIFYMVMAMYNFMFTGYVLLAGASFYAFLIVLLSFDIQQLAGSLGRKLPVKITGGFLIFMSIAIALLWLSIILPPLFDGTIVPVQAEHYTTLIVQGFDLAILLPAAFVSAILFIRERPLGFLLCPVYFIFLSFLMSALTAKVMALASIGYNVFPVIFVIPFFNLVTLICTVLILKRILRASSSQL